MSSGQLTLEQLEEYKQAFLFYDKNGDGTINAGELLAVMRNLGENPTEEEIQNIMNEMDTDKNGKIEFQEFLEKMTERNKYIDETEDLRNAFRVFDKDGDGKISTEELRNFMTTIENTLTEEEINELMSAADQDKDGYVDYEEFVKMMVTDG